MSNSTVIAVCAIALVICLVVIVWAVTNLADLLAGVPT